MGFKAVHAGPLGGARVVDDEVLAAMEEFSFQAPAHNPPYISAMRAFRRSAPEVPLVALFETAFYDHVDEAVTTYAVPYEWKEELGIRRYGFHGASHRAASEKAQELLGRNDLRHISCHLGGSSSLAAIRNGVAVDCSFGMSPQSGLPHNNRTGDIDVFAVFQVMKQKGYGVDEMAEILASQSGLAGISGGSGDVRDLSEAAAAGDARARLALDVFVDAIRRYIGAFLVRLGGVDVLTFSGGIGENSPEVRAAVCEGLSAFGLEHGLPAATPACPGEATISADASPAPHSRHPCRRGAHRGPRHGGGRAPAKARTLRARARRPSFWSPEGQVVNPRLALLPLQPTCQPPPSTDRLHPPRPDPVVSELPLRWLTSLN